MGDIQRENILKRPIYLMGEGMKGEKGGDDCQCYMMLCM